MGDELKCAECKKPAELKCSGCRLVAYCSKEHQKANWKAHKNLCRPFEIKSDVEIGRCLIATRDIAKGDVIFSEQPLVYGPRPHMVEKGPVPCPGCCRLIIAARSPRCEGCDWPVCNEFCEGLKDPERHGYECFVVGLRAHRALDGLHEYYRQDVLLAVRCLLVQRRGLKKWMQLMNMESHYDKRGKGTEIYKDIQERIVDYLHDNFIVKLKALEEKSKNTILPDMSSETLHRICGIIDVNALEINQEAELSALYPTAYLMEHSCVPNTIHTFDNQEHSFKITVRAAMDIKKGEHITTMYTHALWGTQARREHLKETKYFTCSCKRCADATELGTYFSGLRCIGAEGEGCGGTQLPLEPLNLKSEWACDKCPIRLSTNEVSYLVNKIGEEVDAVQLSSPTVRELDGLYKKLLTFLHPNHYHVYSVKHSLVQLYGYQQGYLPNQMSDELLLNKAEMCRELIAITKKLDPGNTRLCLYSGVLYHELYQANTIYAKRKFDSLKPADLMRLLKEADECLINTKEVLKYELNSASGDKLIQLSKTSRKDFERWLERHSIDLANATINN